MLAIANAWGAKANWDIKAKKINITKGKNVYTFDINKDSIIIKNKQPIIDARVFGERIGMEAYMVKEVNAFVLYKNKPLEWISSLSWEGVDGMEYEKNNKGFILKSLI